MHMYAERPRSRWWFLLPVFMGAIGGVIAYFVIRHDDPRKARNSLYLGIIITAVPTVLSLAFGALLGGLGEDILSDAGI